MKHVTGEIFTDPAATVDRNRLPIGNPISPGPCSEPPPSQGQEKTVEGINRAAGKGKPSDLPPCKEILLPDPIVPDLLAD
jgi:hypothetical protein